jgi:alkanesulfonate monooxygenase SsuD/methylene tetrahydromethanopterin reductase-like flavin-dependent oxidoreductase (luciferase family)
MGLGRFVVVADTDGAALALARRAYPRWYQSFTHLHRLHGRSNAHPRPPTFDGLAEAGQGVAGSPQTVADVLRRELAGTGSNYCVGQFAFGDLTLAETLRSIALFAQEVMPQLARPTPVSAL